ncbi:MULTISPECIES: hypothetical protein [unclassified Bradyrhizobium]|uniref:hypothetical protein n=1 Tax=unclassified Bradyrhizobium TaxID=2631580 RepID=UPI00291677C5|nr:MULTISPECIES: hypothetical protein [unclassified Bradyrhizobium]
MRVGFSLSSLKEGRWYEHLVRFALGGAVTVVAGLIARGFGPALGGLFLALPAIFCASATLIEGHEKRRKREAGLGGTRRGQEAAALDSVGAALGSLGLLAFAACFLLLVRHSIPAAFIAASAAWLGVSVGVWWGRQQWRAALRRRATETASPERIRPSGKSLSHAGASRRGRWLRAETRSGRRGKQGSVA